MQDVQTAPPGTLALLVLYWYFTGTLLVLSCYKSTNTDPQRGPTHSQSPGKFKDGMGAIYGMAESIPDRSLVHELARDYIDALYTA